MHQLDYELGLAEMEEEFSGADGRGQAKVVLLGCNMKCNTRHPFSKSKREACKAICKAAYNAKIAAIDAQTAAVEDAVAQQTGSQVGIASDVQEASEQEAMPVTPVTATETVDERVAVEDAPAGMSMTTKVVIGLVAVAAIGGAIWYVRKKK